jgi:hypothetical protein
MDNIKIRNNNGSRFLLNCDIDVIHKHLLTKPMFIHILQMGGNEYIINKYINGANI